MVGIIKFDNLIILSFLQTKAKKHMRILTEKEYTLEAKPALRQVFVNEDYIGKPFSSNITERRIIYEYHYELTPPLSNILINAVSTVGDRGIYWSLVWKTPEEDWQHPNHCYISLSEFLPLYIEKKHKDYQKIKYFFISESILYSPQGKWGIMFSDEGYALLGGTNKFIDLVEQGFPELDSQIYHFLAQLKIYKQMYPHQTNIDWIPELLAHIYGEEAAKKLLIKSQIWRDKRKK